MIKSPFSIKNILIFISMIVISFFLSIMIVTCCMEIFSSVVKMDISSIMAYIIFLILSGIFLMLAIDKARAQVIPKYFECMDAVREYMEFADLKRMLLEEEFTRIEFNDNLKVKLKNSRVRKHESDIYLSKNFVYVKGVYIPRKMIVSMEEDIEYIYFRDMKWNKWRIGRFKKAGSEVVGYFAKGIEFPTLKMSEIRQQELTMWFKENIKTKKDYMHFCELE